MLQITEDAPSTASSTALVPLDTSSGPSPVDVYLAGIAPSSRTTMLARLKVLADFLGIGDPRRVAWWSMGYHHALALRERLQERGYAPATANLTLSALRGVLRASWRLRLMSAEDYHTVASVPAITGERLPAGRALSPAELVALMQTCAADRSTAGPRDAALFALLYGCGLRRSEAAGLDVGDYDAESGALKVRRAKRNKERIVYVADAGAQAALADWLRVRAEHSEQLGEMGESGPLFVAINKAGRLARQRLSADGVNTILSARSRAVEMPHTTPHDFRRTFVGDLLDAGADIAVVQRLAGHANVQTTQKYDRRPEAAKRRAAALLRVPYRRTEG